MAGNVFQARINPLAFVHVDQPWAAELNQAPTYEHVLRFASGLEVEGLLDQLLVRYKAISTEPVRLNIVPFDPRFEDKLVRPLRAAKASYMTGAPLATIALAGMVAEMLAILKWELADVRLNDGPMSDTKQQELFGTTVERLGQERRVAVLKAYGLLTDESIGDFTLIRVTRRKYLHLWSHDHADIDADAIACYHAAVRLSVALIGQVGRDGQIELTRAMFEYLSREGRLEPLP